MNPPFAGKADVHHVMHALGFLRPGGRLVAIMAASAGFREDKLTASLRATVDERGGTMTALPDDSFKESGTGVHTVLVTIPVPAPWTSWADGDAFQVVGHGGHTLGRIRPTEGKDPAGNPAYIFWAITPAGAMSPHASHDAAAAHLTSAA